MTTPINNQKNKAPSFDRVIWIVLDGVGAGELPDASEYGDKGSDTLGNLAKAFKKKTGRPLNLPNLEAWGIAFLTPMEGMSANRTGQVKCAFGKALELSKGKDTTSGHWEMAGLVVKKPFPIFSEGFPMEVIDRWIRENNLPGVLGNKPASGTDIIRELGQKHLETGKPILYTSADSVWQVAAHEESFGLDRLYSICKSARKICDELQIGRVIARPFIGNPAKGIPFERTYNRKDYAQLPFGRTFLDILCESGVSTLGIGKISNIYAGKGIQKNLDTRGNTHGLQVLLEQIDVTPDKGKPTLIFCNLIDFDMLYGHRREVVGFGEALEEFDRVIPEIQKKMTDRDLLVLSADHGNDPTFRGTDHTREYTPIFAYHHAPVPMRNSDLGIRQSFADIGATITHALLGDLPETGLAGKSFLPELGF